MDTVISDGYIMPLYTHHLLSAPPLFSKTKPYHVVSRRPTSPVVTNHTTKYFIFFLYIFLLLHLVLSRCSDSHSFGFVCGLQVSCKKIFNFRLNWICRISFYKDCSVVYKKNRESNCFFAFSNQQPCHDMKLTFF